MTEVNQYVPNYVEQTYETSNYEETFSPEFQQDLEGLEAQVGGLTLELEAKDVTARIEELTDISEEQKEIKISVRVLVGTKSAGGLIGKGGAIIKKSRQDSGAWIDIADSIRGAVKRIVTVQGSIEKVLSALQFISDRLAERKRENRRAALPGGGEDPENNPSFEIKNSLTLLVANGQVGCIIGKAGAQIRETRALSGANVKVSEKLLEQSTEKTVTIEGTSPQVHTAVSVICRQLLETQDRSIARVPFQPRPVFMDPYAAFDPYGLPAPYAPGGFQGGQQRPIGGGNAEFGAGGQFGGLGALPGPELSGPLQTIVIPVPDALIGSVIGRGGLIIKEIRQRSRSQVKIADLQANATDRMITITGTRHSNEIAVALVYEKMNQFDPAYRKPQREQLQTQRF